jgi:hypothetical protein
MMPNPDRLHSTESFDIGVNKRTVFSFDISFLQIEIQSLSYSDFLVGGVEIRTIEIYHF